uniref:WD_REPEATS_REGION domain-containing protein n=1 Tax=Macrostomum lignano TaxID=282301 RepID=A0A1I8GLG2_9PLAT
MSSEESSGGGGGGGYGHRAAVPQHQLLDRKRLTSGLDSSGGASGVRSGGGGGGSGAGEMGGLTPEFRVKFHKIMGQLETEIEKEIRRQHCQFVTRLLGHTDGVWGLSAFPRRNLVASCSADGTARVWLCNDRDSCCLIEYRGHAGSVNSVRFHPSSDILLTASGDTAAHLIRLPSHDLPASASASVGGSEPCKVISEPALVLSGHHTAPVIGADFISGCEVVTGSWDRVCPMALWSAETGKLIRIYEGHEDIITGVACHPGRRLALTSSKDGYFGLWDLNMGEPVDLHLHRAHSGAVTCAAFAGPERIVSGGSDRMLRLWDMRKLSTALTTIRLDAAVNRLAVHPYYPSIAALPLDNRHVQLCHLGGSGGGGGGGGIGTSIGVASSTSVNVSAGGSGGSGSGGGVGNLLAPAGVGASIGGGGGGQSSAAN